MPRAYPIVNGEWGRALPQPGEIDPVYDEIEHGLFRTKVIAYMQLFGVQLAHEALLRDVMATAGRIGLVETEPPANKPVADVYLGLNKLNDAPQALTITAPSGVFVLAGSDAADTRVVVVFVGDDPGSFRRTQVDLTVDNLPWGAASFTATRFVVSEDSPPNDSGAVHVPITHEPHLGPVSD